MRKLARIIFITLSVLAIVPSCSKFLDKEFDATLNDTQVFTDERLTTEFLTNTYTLLPDGLAVAMGGDINGFYDCVTDNGTTNGFHSVSSTLVNGGVSETNNPEAFWWTNMFTGIRKTCLFLENVDRSPISNKAIPGDDNNHLKSRYKAEARLLRAIYHFELMKRWGNIPIITKYLGLNDNLNLQRDSTTDVVNFIASECDSVFPNLPFNYTNPGNAGRVSGAAALALKSRVLLYGASPLFNPANDKARWQKAADAAKQFMTANGGVFILYPDYAGLFTTPFNGEVILSTFSTSSTLLETTNEPTGYTGAWGLSNPSQELVDAYEMKNGKLITDPSSGYSPANPYNNRDPRLDLTILHNGSQWLGRAVETFEGGKDKSANITTLTGYYVRKWMNPAVDLTVSKIYPQWHAWIMFRYAEILLNYAEAQNEAVGPDASVYDAINQVRGRAGIVMPGLPSGLTQDLMRDRIQNERRVELAFEDHRYYDVRRWKQGEKYLNSGIHGMKITGSVYQVIAVEAEKGRVFDPKFYFFPIPYAERTNAPNLGQNPGY